MRSILLAAALLSCGPASAAPAPSELDRGVKLLEKGRYDQALAAFEQAERAEPSSAEPSYFAGVALNRLGRHDQALERLQSAAGKDGRHPDLDFELGWAFLKLKRWEEAAAALERYEAAQPGRAQTSEFLGRAYLELGRAKEAQAKLEEAVKRDPRLGPSVKVYMARIQAGDDPRAAQQTMLSVIQEWPRSPISQLVRERLQEAGVPPSALAPPKPWRVYVGLSGGYNSNVISLGTSIPLPGDISRKDAGNLHANVGGGYAFRLSPKDSLDLSYGFSADLYEPVDGSDLLDHSLSARWDRFISQSFSVSAAPAVGYTMVAGKQFRESLGGRVQADYRWSPALATDAAYAFNRSFYFPTNGSPVSSRDGNSHTVSLTQYYNPSGTRLQLRGNYAHIFNRPNGSDFVSDADSYQFGVGFPVYLGAHLDASYTLTETRYRNFNSVVTFQQERRSDNNESVNVTLRRPVLRWLVAHAAYTHVRNGSNIPLFNYVQWTLTTGLTASF